MFAASLGVHAEDQALRVLRHPAAFHTAAAMTPNLADWFADDPTPASGVYAMTNPPNVLGALATAWPQPLAGLFPVGDAACVTDPMFGRGMSLALTHAFQLADALNAHPEVGETQSKEAVRVATDLFTPWYQQACLDTGVRVAGFGPHHRPAAADGGRHLSVRTVAGAARHDATVWRGLVRVLMGLRTPEEVFDADFVERVRVTHPPEPTGGPTRADLLAAVTARAEALL